LLDSFLLTKIDHKKLLVAMVPRQILIRVSQAESYVGLMILKWGDDLRRFHSRGKPVTLNLFIILFSLSTLWTHQ